MDNISCHKVGGGPEYIVYRKQMCICKERIDKQQILQ